MKKFSGYFSIHYSFIVFILLNLFTGLAGLILIYFCCLILHELSHAIVAKKLGYKIGKIKLMATGAILEAESDEFSFGDEIKIAISGPLFNFVFCLIIIVFWWLVPESYNYTMDLCVINLVLFAFNILPIFPLDGGRILLALLSKKIERKVALKVTRIITLIFSLCLFFLFILSLFSYPNFSMGMMAILLFISAISEEKNAIYKRTYFCSKKLEKIQKRGLEVRHICVNKDMQKSKLLKLLDSRHYTIFVLIDNCSKVVAMLSELELIKMFEENITDSI